MTFEPSTAHSDCAEPGSPAPPTARFTLDRAPFAGQSFAVRFRVCANPCCPCGLVGFVCRPETAPEPAAPPMQPPPLLCFDLDICRRRLDTQIQSAPEGVALGRAFLAEAQAGQWQWLSDLFRSIKRRQMETMDLDTLDVDLPRDVKAGGGVMLGYHQIFPWADSFRFTRQGEDWLVDDLYCVRPGCDCTEAGLSFYRLPAGTAPSAGPLRCATFLHLDYCTGEFGLEEAHAGSPAAAALVSALRAANPALADTLRHRHGQVKQLGRRLMPKSAHPLPGSWPPSGEVALDTATEEWLSQPPDPRITRALARPGRNDPCPCGSGKKFKKCCGAA